MIATIADLVARIPVLWNPTALTFGVDENILNDILLTAQDVVEQTLQPYYGNDLKLAKYQFTPPLRLTSEPDFQASWGLTIRSIKDLNAGLATDTEYIIVEATSDEDFKVYGSISGNQGEGSLGSDFTSKDSSFVIEATAWTSETIKFVTGDRFIFSRSWYERILRYITSLWAAHNVIEGRYMSEAANDLEFGDNSFMDQYNRYIGQLISSEKPLTLKAPNATYTDPNFVEKQPWQDGYNINNLGLDE